MSGEWQIYAPKQKKLDKRQLKKKELELQKKEQQTQERLKEEEIRLKTKAFITDIPTSGSVFAQLNDEEDEKAVKTEERKQVLTQKQQKQQEERLQKQQAKQKKKKKQPVNQTKKAPKALSLDKAAAEIKSESLKSELDALKSQFPNHVVLLKKIAESLEIKFDKVKETIPKPNATNYVQKANKGLIPNSLSKSNISLIAEIVKSVPEKHLEEFYVWLIETFLKTKAAGLASSSVNGVGLAILLQIINQSVGSPIYKSVDKIRTALMKKKNTTYVVDPTHQNELFFIIGPTLNAFPRFALYLWAELLAPSLASSEVDSNVKQLGIVYIEQILSNPEKQFASTQQASLSSPAIDSMFDLRYGNKLDNNLQARYDAVFDKLIDVTFFVPENFDPKVFGVFLRHAASPTHGDDAINLLARSLSSYPSCFKTWEKHYVRNVKESVRVANVLKKQIKQNSTEKNPKFLSSLSRTLESLNATNKQLISGSYVSNAGKKIQLRDMGITLEDVQAAQKTFSEILQSISQESKHNNKDRTTINRNAKTGESGLLPLIFLLILVFALIGLYFYDPVLVETHLHDLKVKALGLWKNVQKSYLGK